MKSRVGYVFWQLFLAAIISSYIINHPDMISNYNTIALTRKICGILSKKLQKLALSSYYRTCLSKQPYFAIFVAAFLTSHKFCRFRLVVDIDQLHNCLKHLTFAYS